MTFSKPNRSAATLTKCRTGDSVSPFSGMCVTCIEGCPGLCEIGMSAYRGAEVLYPQPFGTITAAAEKDYPVDYSHLNIQGSAVGAVGIEADPDKAIFPRVSTEVALGRDKGIKLRMPIVIPGLGSTDVAKRNWEGLGIGAAISGIILTVGENVCAMDVESEIKNGRVVRSPDMEFRVRTFKDWYDGYGAIVVQANVEDTRLGVQEYVIEKLGVEAVELKWGQGAKDIGGEVKIRDYEKALMLRKRGYIVLPDPEDPEVKAAFEAGVFKEFERHSRIGMVDLDGFVKRVEELRKAGAKYVFLKTGAYKATDLARAIKYASIAGIDVLTIDGAGGGTGMSPWRMMNEWGIPTIYLQAMAYNFASMLAARGEYVPDLVIAGGFTLEDHIFKGLAMGAPFFKAVGMARAPITAAMVGKTLGEHIKNGTLPKSIAEKYGSSVEELFVTSTELHERFGDKAKEIPPAAMGVYTYIKRLSQGLRQLMCGARKFALQYLERDDLLSLTRECADVTGIPYVMEADMDRAEDILLGRAE